MKERGMSERTIHEIREAHGETAASILNAHNEFLGEIAAERGPEEGRYLDRLSGQERMRLMREQKTERARESQRAAKEAYTAEIERYRAELSARVGYLRGRLFKVEDAGALSRAALATDTELGTLMEIATHAGNVELGRAVFVASEQRGLGNLMTRYFEQLDPEARELYEEWTRVPPAEVLERQIQSIETVIPEPDPHRLMPTATATT